MEHIDSMLSEWIKYARARDMETLIVRTHKLEWIATELARVREELAKQERLSVDIVNGHRAIVERVARRAAHLSKYHLELSIADCAAQAMREEG